MLREESLAGDGHGGQRAFHVGAAATEEHAVRNGGLEGRMPPFVDGTGRYHVGMTGEDHDRRAAAVRRPEVLDGSGGQRFEREPQGFERLAEDLLAALIPRAHAIALDEARSQLDDLSL